MSKKFQVVNSTLATALAASGTFTFNYPSSMDEDSYAGYGHVAVVGAGFGVVLNSPVDFTLTFGTASVTFTYASGKTTIPAGTVISIQINLPGDEERRHAKNPANHPLVTAMSLMRVDLGSPLIADVNGIAESQATTPAGNLTLQARAATFCVSDRGGSPFGRALTVDSDDASNTSVLTITGTDYLDNTLVENITVNGTTVVAGVKAFFTVTQIAFTNDTDGNVFVGFGDVLGLPFYLPGIDDCPVTFEYEDNILKANPGTFVAGVDTEPTATTGDVRGTYLPLTSVPDGAQNFVLFIPSSDPTYQGQAQFAG